MRVTMKYDCSPQEGERLWKESGGDALKPVTIRGQQWLIVSHDRGRFSWRFNLEREMKTSCLD